MDATSNKNETFGQIQQSDAGFTFVDFFPKILSSGLFKSTTYENFRVLVDRANEFLRSNTKWKILTCESVHVKLRGEKIDSNKVTYKKNMELFTSYIRGLRLWLTERKNEKEREQQIGYTNLIPQKLEHGGVFGVSRYETLDALIGRFNLLLKTNPLPGRIITIESKEMMFTNFEKFDPDLSNWTESGRGYGSFVFVIRIFYEITDDKFEEIGIADFFPGITSEGSFFSTTEYEPFSKVMQQASTWLSHNGHLRFCNAQTLEMKIPGERNIDAQRMVSTAYSREDYHVRILRMAYTKPFGNLYSSSEKPPAVTRLTCRDFAPVQLKTGIFAFEYENLTVTKERISGWVNGSGARVVSAETTHYRIKSGGEKKQGTEATFTDGSDRIIYTDEYWIFIIRLYIDGGYTEPPPDKLLAVPEIAKSACHIS